MVSSRTARSRSNLDRWDEAVPWRSLLRLSHRSSRNVMIVVQIIFLVQASPVRPDFLGGVVSGLTMTGLEELTTPLRTSPKM